MRGKGQEAFVRRSGELGEHSRSSPASRLVSLASRLTPAEKGGSHEDVGREQASKPVLVNVMPISPCV